jgi:UDP-4-amino-4,6-dideoxy-N-acetyl-beta-L-altrosamine transaminase
LEKLAIEGGKPVRETYLPYGKQWIDDNDIQAVVEVLKSDWLTTGPKVSEFEEKFAEYVGAKYAVAVSSGTAALHAAVYAAGIIDGDEVITTPITFAASANCVLFQGGTPVFTDVQPDTLNIDPQKIEEKITSRTKAIIPVDFTGLPCELDEIHKIARKHNLWVIEDACHALGAEYRGKMIGSLSDMSVFSFHPVKHITTGEGGMITTNNSELASKLRYFRNHAISVDAHQRQAIGSWFYEIGDLGYNYRLTDFQCALGIKQLEKIDRFLERRREIAARYNTAFADMPEITLPTVREYVKHAWHIYVIQLNLDLLTVDRAKIFAALRAENIGVNVHYIPVHLHPYYRKTFGYKRGDYPISESRYDRIITLPIFPRMSDDDVSDVIVAMTKAITNYRA